jgi:hypothetical protein
MKFEIRLGNCIQGYLSSLNKRIKLNTWLEVTYPETLISVTISITLQTIEEILLVVTSIPYRVLCVLSYLFLKSMHCCFKS